MMADAWNTLKESALPKWIIANFKVRKMYSTVEIMDGCEYSTEIIIVPLKECKTGTKFFGNT